MRYVLATLVLIAHAIPASASLQITGGISSISIPANNNFHSSFAAIGIELDNVFSGANVLVTQDGTIEFFYHGGESGYDNRFVVGNLLSIPEVGPPASDGTPLNLLLPGASFGSISVLANQTFSLLGVAFEVVNPNGAGQNASAGELGFGVYYSSQAGSNGDFQRLFFGFDDSGAGPDKDFDDMIVSAVFTPSPSTAQLEPMPEAASIATWIGLVGMAGWAARRSTRQRQLA